MLGRRAKINTLGASELKFVAIVRPKVRETSTPKNFERFIVRLLFV
jgi:hypothetical protein